MLDLEPSKDPALGTILSGHLHAYWRQHGEPVLTFADVPPEAKPATEPGNVAKVIPASHHGLLKEPHSVLRRVGVELAGELQERSPIIGRSDRLYGGREFSVRTLKARLALLR